jgi:pimeloyl-ACP methyl ester carboxylesterase
LAVEIPDGMPLAITARMNFFLIPLALIAAGSATTVEATGERLTEFRSDLHREGLLKDIQVDGRRHCIADLGQGPPVVLLHGLGGSIYDWRHLLRPLSRDYRVIAVDLLGAGESELPPDEDYSVAAQARRVKGILDHLRIDRASLVGNSYGGGIALRFAQDWPERTARLVLIDSICYPENIPTYVTLANAPCATCIARTIPLGTATRWVLQSGNGTISRIDKSELAVYFQELRAPGRPAAIVHTVRAIVPPDTTEFQTRLKAVQAPALLIWGKDDQTVPVALGRRLVKDLPDARLEELDAGHIPNQERPREVLRLMQDFLK